MLIIFGPIYLFEKSISISGECVETFMMPSVRARERERERIGKDERDG